MDHGMATIIAFAQTIMAALARRGACAASAACGGIEQRRRNNGASGGARARAPAAAAGKTAATSPRTQQNMLAAHRARSMAWRKLSGNGSGQRKQRNGVAWRQWRRNGVMAAAIEMSSVAGGAISAKA
jgi:hypothetical protein